MIIVDTNILAYLVIPGDNRELAEAALRKDPEWSAPLLWRSEMRNVLSIYVRRNAFSLEQACIIMSDAEVVIAHRSYSVDSTRVLELADSSGCTAYDCEFAYLAEKLNVPLMTSDKKLLSAFPNIAVSMGAFLS